MKTDTQQNHINGQASISPSLWSGYWFFSKDTLIRFVPLTPWIVLGMTPSLRTLPTFWQHLFQNRLPFPWTLSSSLDAALIVFLGHAMVQWFAVPGASLSTKPSSVWLQVCDWWALTFCINGDIEHLGRIHGLQVLPVLSFSKSVCAAPRGIQPQYFFQIFLKYCNHGFWLYTLDLDQLAIVRETS